MTSLHSPDEHERDLANRLATWAVERAFDGPNTIGRAPVSLDRPSAITSEGIGVERAVDLWRDVIAPENLALDHRRFMAFLPIAPAPMATVVDMVVGAAALGAESRLEATGAVDAENEALSFLSHVFGLPDSAGGCFVSGGTAGNLSALAVARDEFRRRTNQQRCVAFATAGAHSSVGSALHLLDVELVDQPTPNVCAIIGTAGTTNAGLVDNLAELADIAADLGAWFHVDAAYGGPAILAPSARGRFAGIERADSIVVDPHKWLFGPLDCGALLYRDATRGLTRIANGPRISTRCRAPTSSTRVTSRST